MEHHRFSLVLLWCFLCFVDASSQSIKIDYNHNSKVLTCGWTGETSEIEWFLGEKSLNLSCYDKTESDPTSTLNPEFKKYKSILKFRFDRCNKLEFEGVYKCINGSGNETTRNVYITDKDKNASVDKVDIFDGNPLHIDCGIKFGSLAATNDCIKIRLQYGVEKFIDGVDVEKKLKGISFNNDTQNLHFNLSSPDGYYPVLRCQVVNTELCPNFNEFMNFNGPEYRIYYKPLVSLGTDLDDVSNGGVNIVAKGTNISFNCMAKDRNDESSDYDFRLKVTYETNGETITLPGNSGVVEISSAVQVSCEANRTINGKVLKNTTVLNFTVAHAPRVTLQTNLSKEVSHSSSFLAANGSSVTINCSVEYAEQVSNTQYNVSLTIKDAKTDETIVSPEPVHTKENMMINETVVLTSDVIVSCNAFGKVNAEELKVQDTLHISVIPSLRKEMFSIYTSQCGILTIALNDETVPVDISVTVAGQEVIIDGKTRRNIPLGNTSTITLQSSLDGVGSGNKLTIEIPANEKCTDDTVLELELELSDELCSDGNTNDNQIKKVISSLLRNASESCNQNVCPEFNETNYKISDRDGCRVSLRFQQLPPILLHQVLESFCNSTEQCKLKKNDPLTTPTPKSINMHTWMIACLCAIGVLSILALCLFLFCIIKCMSYLYIKQRNADLERGDGGGQGAVEMREFHRRSMEDPLGGVAQHQHHHANNGSIIRVAPAHHSHSAVSHSTTHGETSSRTSSTSSRFTCNSYGSKCSNEGSETSSKASSAYSKCSLGSHHCSGSRLRPSSLSQSSMKYDPISKVPTVTINIQCTSEEMARALPHMVMPHVVEFPQPLVRMFNELGASHTETLSADTGLGSVETQRQRSIGTNPSRNRSSIRSSGYEGSIQLNHVNNDPNILNPHGRSGFTSNHRHDIDIIEEEVLMSSPCSNSSSHSGQSYEHNPCQPSCSAV